MIRALVQAGLDDPRQPAARGRDHARQGQSGSAPTGPRWAGRREIIGVPVRSSSHPRTSRSSRATRPNAGGSSTIWWSAAGPGWPGSGPTTTGSSSSANTLLKSLSGRFPVPADRRPAALRAKPARRSTSRTPHLARAREVSCWSPAGDARRSRPARQQGVRGHRADQQRRDRRLQGHRSTWRRSAADRWHRIGRA